MLALQKPSNPVGDTTEETRSCRSRDTSSSGASQLGFLSLRGSKGELAVPLVQLDVPPSTNGRMDDVSHFFNGSCSGHPSWERYMASLQRSKKAGSPPSPARYSKLPKFAKRTESAPDMRAKRRLSQSPAKKIAGHIRATTKRRQAKRDSR